MKEVSLPWKRYKNEKVQRLIKQGIDSSESPPNL